MHRVSGVGERATRPQAGSTGEVSKQSITENIFLKDLQLVLGLLSWKGKPKWFIGSFCALWTTAPSTLQP